MDIISDLGEMAFASRLRRLGERLAKDVTLLYHKLDIDFEARWFSVFYSLHCYSPITVTGLADSLGISHTGVKQLAREMAEKKLVTWSKGKDDKRQQLISLTAKGKEIAQQLLPVWEEVRKATKELLDTTDCNMLGGLKNIEQQLDQRNMYERVWFQLKGSLPGEIEIHEYSPAMKKYFKSLNYEWLEENFTIEKADNRLLSDPNTRIVKRGGAVLFASLEGDVVGTCALIKHRNGVFELAKMAVTKKYQGRGIGKKLIIAIIDKAKTLGASELYLQTNAKLKSANYLYNKLGFIKTTAASFIRKKYRRSTFVMKLDLTNLKTI
ncbi:MAG: bifunctional helix-turn-helix transcriptional regulator/GNAT family N-acetyltransferase [Ignavibacteriales bacterium]|nr:bifunctional helix-turn-helix transcriptional regulator/GNAT family N-acetyltransferase [Ignavibacteriales bacterium]